MPRIQRIDYSGRRFGLVTFTTFSHCEGARAVWNVICDCGTPRTEFVSHQPSLKTRKSCRCKSEKEVAVWSGNRRQCRACDKALPATKYFYHEGCAPYGETPYTCDDYGYAQA